ncbi:hypothetical protein EMCRGX_G000370 [Ephydatia muelleri]
MTSKGERYPYGGLQVKAELRPKSHDGAVVPGEVEDHGDGTYTITLTPQTAGPHQLLIPMDGQHGNIYIAARGSDSIKVFTPEGTNVRSYGDVKFPTGIVIDGIVVEAHGHCSVLQGFEQRACV